LETPVHNFIIMKLFKKLLYDFPIPYSRQGSSKKWYR
jgi:hypothetical protein